MTPEGGWLPGHLGTPARQSPVGRCITLCPARSFAHDHHAESEGARVNSDKSSTYRTNVERRIIGGKPGASAPAVQRLTVDAESAGQRLDNFLLRILKGVPKTHVYRVIRSGEVRVNKGRAAADTRVAEGDEIRVPPMRLPEKTGFIAPAREFPILFEDEHLLAIAKPAGVAVHGGSGVSSGVIERRPSSLAGETTRTCRSPTASSVLCSGWSITFRLFGQAPTTSAW